MCFFIHRCLYRQRLQLTPSGSIALELLLLKNIHGRAPRKSLSHFRRQKYNIFYKVAYTFGDKYQVTNTIVRLPVNSKDDTGEPAIEMKLASLKNLLDKGIISDEEYAKKRASIINTY